MLSNDSLKSCSLLLLGLARVAGCEDTDPLTVLSYSANIYVSSWTATQYSLHGTTQHDELLTMQDLILLQHSQKPLKGVIVSWLWEGFQPCLWIADPLKTLWQFQHWQLEAPWRVTQSFANGTKKVNSLQGCWSTKWLQYKVTIFLNS